jgi:hypothetical protein
MEIVSPAELLWSSDDEANWNAFLQSNTGKRLLPRVMERAPVLLAGGATNDILVRSGEFRGFSECIRTFLDLTHTPPAPPSPTMTYPPLESDEKWDDGQKLDT